MSKHHKRFKSKTGKSSDRRKLRFELFKRQGGLCHYCRSTMRILKVVDGFPPPDMATFEHIEPLSEGGAATGSNLVLACVQCNMVRSEQTTVKSYTRACDRWGVPVTSEYLQIIRDRIG